MTSEINELYVWIWLPGSTDPVVAGKLYRESGKCFFIYGKSYLARKNAIAIFDKELPAMLIYGHQRLSRLSVCLEASYVFLLSRSEALNIVKDQIGVISDNWSRVCDEAELNEVDRNFLWQRQFLNPYIFQGMEKDVNYNSKI